MNIFKIKEFYYFINMESNLLLSRTFMILGGMLVLTTFTARINKAFETPLETFITVGGSFLMLFLIMFNAETYPMNIIFVSSIGALILTISLLFFFVVAIIILFTNLVCFNLLIKNSKKDNLSILKRILFGSRVEFFLASIIIANFI